MNLHTCTHSPPPLLKQTSPPIFPPTQFNTATSAITRTVGATVFKSLAYLNPLQKLSLLCKAYACIILIQMTKNYPYQIVQNIPSVLYTDIQYIFQTDLHFWTDYAFVGGLHQCVQSCSRNHCFLHLSETDQEQLHIMPLSSINLHEFQFFRI